jgi:hypothetical protein
MFKGKLTPTCFARQISKGVGTACLVFIFAANATPSPDKNVVLRWDNAALQEVRDSAMGAPMASRALAIVHTCMYDTWAAYDEKAVGTQLAGVLRRPLPERTLANKERAISYAAFTALTDVLPGGAESIYKPLMHRLGYDPGEDSTDIQTPVGIGRVACAAVLEFRHHDKSNQLGDLAPGSYSDWSGYSPANPPASIPARTAATAADRWQPLVYVDFGGNLTSQRFVGAQWCFVTPFALERGDELRTSLGPGPAKFGSTEYEAQARELVELSANLTDRQKMIAEYWFDGPNSEQAPGHWLRFAESVSMRDHHTLDDDVKMLFALSNALLDAGIAAWDAKRAYDSVRPLTAISTLFRGKQIRAWGGPGKGTVEMDGSQWIPYEPVTFPTPPFPDFVSGHSAYSAAAARILALWTGSERFDYSITLPVGSSKIEPGITPRSEIVLNWETFADAADEAGMSRRYGGIHFSRADIAGRKLGHLVADRAWAKAEAYFDGTNSSHASAFEISAAQ